MSNQDFGNKHNGSKTSLPKASFKNKRVFIPNKTKGADKNQDDSIAAMFAKDSDPKVVNIKDTTIVAEQAGRPVAYRCQTVKGLSADVQATEEGIQFEAVFEDSEIPSDDTKRSGFATMLTSLKPSDMVHVHSLYYMAQDMTELNARIKLVLTTGASLYFVEEKLYFVSLDDMFTKQWMNITETINAFNAKTRSMKHIKGIATSLMKGGRTGRKQALSGTKLEQFRQDAIVLGKTELIEKYGVSSQTIWRYKNMSEEDAQKLIKSGKEQEKAENVA